MALRLALALLLTVAGCGASGTDQLAEPTPSATTSTPRPTTAGPTATATVAATAQTGTASPYPVRSPSPSAAPSTLHPTDGTTVVRDGDSGSTIHLRVGQQVRVQLQDGTWDPPTSSDAAVVARRSSSGGYPTNQPVDAVFQAVKAGTAELQAQSDAACFHTQPRCLMATRLWQLHVVVAV